MNIRYLLWLPVLGFLMAAGTPAATAQGSYPDYEQLSRRLQTLNEEYGNLTELQSLGTSPGGRNIWLLTIGRGDVKNHPAVAVIGGAEGSHILGSELALQFAEGLLARSASDSIRTLLDQATFYVAPRINPDAAVQYFADLQYERDVNNTDTDEDRDGPKNEDPYEDLNNDGMITMMRVESQSGDWIVHEDDPRVMSRAQQGEGEYGNYRLLTEGRDNDRDESFNEDGDGGVNINKNFTFNYPYFQPGAGENMANQPETRAIMDFLFEKGWNVYSVISFGPENNLSKPLNFNAGAVNQRVITGWYQEDIAVNKLVSDRYNDIISLTDTPKGAPRPGDLFQWAYFHYGRFSFSTPGWWTPALEDRKDKARKFENSDAHYLAWADRHGIDAFAGWQTIDHPDFPNRTVEVGGIKPYRKTTPPYTAVDSLARQHTRFIIEVARMHPHIELVNVKTEKVGDGLTRLTAELYNSGAFPTASRLGERTRWVRGVGVDLNLSDGLAIVSGQPYQSFDSIQPHESKTMSWLIRGTGSLTLKAGAPNTGFATIEQTIE